MMPFRGHARWGKMVSAGAKLRARACHPPKEVNKAEGLTYISLQTLIKMTMGLYHPPDGVTNLKYKLLCFLTPNKIIF